MTSCFHSRWRAQLQEFLDFKRIGYAYESGGKALHSFDKFAGAHPDWPLRQAMQGWIDRFPNRQAVTTGRDVEFMRQFGLFSRRFDARAFVPERIRLAPSARTHFRPCLLSLAQIKMVVAGARHRRGPMA